MCKNQPDMTSSTTHVELTTLVSLTEHISSSRLWFIGSFWEEKHQIKAVWHFLWPCLTAFNVEWKVLNIKRKAKHSCLRTNEDGLSENFGGKLSGSLSSWADLRRCIPSRRQFVLVRAERLAWSHWQIRMLSCLVWSCLCLPWFHAL